VRLIRISRGVAPAVRSCSCPNSNVISNPVISTKCWISGEPLRVVAAHEGRNRDKRCTATGFRRVAIDHRFVLNKAQAVFYARVVSSEEQFMQKLTLIAALAFVIAGSPVLACDWNKEAKTETQTIVTEQAASEATAQQEVSTPAPVQRVEDGASVVADGGLH
jgi:hypothetical protein